MATTTVWESLRDLCVDKMKILCDLCIVDAVALPEAATEKLVAYEVTGLTGDNFQTYVYIQSLAPIGETTEVVFEYNFIYKDSVKIQVMKSNRLTSRDIGIWVPERPLLHHEMVDFLNFINTNLAALSTLTLPVDAITAPK